MTGEVSAMKDEQWTNNHSSSTGGAGWRWRQRLLVALGSAILGQAMIYHHAAPFVVIFSLLVWQRRRNWYAPFMAGGLIGTFFGVGWMPALVLIGWALLVPVPWHRPGWLYTKWPLLGLGAAAVFGVGQPWTTYSLVIVASITAGSILLFYFLSLELEKLAVGDLDRRTLVLALAALGCFIAGLAGYRIYGVNPGLFIGGMVMLAAASVQGPAGGAVAGATLGITLAVRGGSSLDMVGILVAGGYLAGWFQTRHWRLGSLGLVAGVLVYAVFIQLPQPLQPFWISIAGAAALFQACPDAVVILGRQWIDSLGGSLGPDMLHERMVRIAEVMKEMARAFRVEEDVPTPDTQLVQAIVDSTCKKCSLYRSCWEDEFYRSYRGMVDLCGRAEQGVVTADDLVGDLARRCIRPDEVSQATNLAMNRERERANFALRIKESRALAELQLTGLADLVQEMARDAAVDRPPKRRRWRREALPYRVGVAKRPRRGGVVSGDSELIFDLSETKVVFGISDGMGVGPRAAWESGTAMALMERLLMAGFTQSLAVRAVNTTLLLRSVDDHFATLDLLMVDREAHRMEIVKVAASPTFVKRRGQVFEIQSHSLPVGIIQDVAIDPLVSSVEGGDMVVMVTDGVLGVDQTAGEARLKALLKELPPGDPTTMAETILSFMLGDHRDGRDDALAMVILLGSAQNFKNTDWTADTPVPEWQRVTPVSVGRPVHRG